MTRDEVMLKPCPFCGGEAILQSDDAHDAAARRAGVRERRRSHTADLFGSHPS